MAIISLTAEELQGRQLLDETGRGIGEISDLYVDDDGRPTGCWSNRLLPASSASSR